MFGEANGFDRIRDEVCDLVDCMFGAEVLRDSGHGVIWRPTTGATSLGDCPFDMDRRILVVE